MRARLAGLVAASAVAGACPTGPDYGEYAIVVESAEARLAIDGCDRTAIEGLARALAAAGHPSEGLDRLAARPDRCRGTPELSALSLDLAEQASRWKDAEAFLDRAIADARQDASLHTRRGAVRANAGDAAGAAADRRLAFLLEPETEVVAIAYARGLGATSGDCAAWEAWGFLRRLHRDRAAEAKLQQEAIDPDGRCARAEGQALAVRETLTAQQVFALPGTMGGQPVRVATDSAMPITLVSPAVASAMGVVPSEEVVITRSAFGTSAGRPVDLPPITVGGLTVSGLHGIVGDPQLRDVDVVVGVDFMLRVDLIRSHDGRWDLVPLR